MTQRAAPSSDVLERLRALGTATHRVKPLNMLLDERAEAAATIERLSAELERVNGALAVAVDTLNAAPVDKSKTFTLADFLQRPDDAALTLPQTNYERSQSV